MAEITLFCPTIDTEFQYDPDNPTKYTEQLSWAILKNMAAMQTAGFVLLDGQAVQDESFQALWEAQTNKIEKQSGTAMIVKDTFNARYLDMEKMSDIKDGLLGELVEEILGGVVEAVSGIPYVGILVEFLVGNLGTIISYLRAVLINHAQICDAIKAENDVLAALSISTDNYHLRDRKLQLNDDLLDTLQSQITAVEREIAEREKMLPTGDVWNRIAQGIEDIGNLDATMEFLGGSRLHLKDGRLDYPI